MVLPESLLFLTPFNASSKLATSLAVAQAWKLVKVRDSEVRKMKEVKKKSEAERVAAVREEGIEGCGSGSKDGAGVHCV